MPVKLNHEYHWLLPLIVRSLVILGKIDTLTACNISRYRPCASKVSIGDRKYFNACASHVKSCNDNSEFINRHEYSLGEHYEVHKNLR
jgi:hypothetical protein